MQANTVDMYDGCKIVMYMRAHL